MKSSVSIVRVLALCSLFVLLLAGCKKEPETLISDQPTPNWTAPEQYDMTSSMTAVVRVDLTRTYPSQVKEAESAINEGDLLAAFIGEECVGVTKPAEGNLFYLYISGPKSGSDDAQVTLRYYSALLKNTFAAKQTIPYVNDAHHGSVTEPLTPDFFVAK